MKYQKENISVFDLKGKDVIDFLQRISTNDIKKIGDKDSLRTIFLNEKGKIIDFITVIRYLSTLLLVTSKGNENKVKDFLNKYIISDDVYFDIHATNKITFIPSGEDGLYKFKGVNFTDGNYFYSDSFRFNKIISIEFKKDSIDLKELIGSSSFLSESDFRKLAIENAYVYDSNELNEDLNPLECHLRDFISFDKGCYIGQEVIARLDSQGKIPKVMVMINSDSVLERGNKIYFDENGLATECGFVTSSVKTKDGYKALAFIRNINLNDRYNYYINKGTKEFVSINKFKILENDKQN